MNNPENKQANAPSIPEQSPNLYDHLDDVEQMLGLDVNKMSPEDVKLFGGLAIEAANIEAATYRIPHTEKFPEDFPENE